MINLLHLSDLHFGSDHDGTARHQRNGALDPLLEELAKREPKLDVLVISGDLSWQGKAAGYKELTKWLTGKLFPATGLSPAECVVCPGNHDLDREEAIILPQREHDPDRADNLLKPELLKKGFARPFHRFVKFAKDLGIPAPQLQNKPNYLAGVQELNGIRFLCLNSAWFCRNSKTDRTQLWVGQPQLESLLQKFDLDKYNRETVTVAVLHHPPDWFHLNEVNQYGNRKNTYAYLAARSHAILSGHTHGAIERSTRCYDRAWLFLNGAAYDSHNYRNNFSILQIDLDKRAITRLPWELDPRVPKWEAKPPQPYSLKTEGPVRGSPDTSKYFDWLRGQTQLINLDQLKLERDKTPPAFIDVLYMRLMTRLPATKGEGLERAEPVPLEEALRIPRLVIEGKPGGGKTTFVRWTAWNRCRTASAAAGFPVLVRIRELDQHITKTLDRGKPGDPTLDVDTRWIAHFLAAKGWGLDENFFLQKVMDEDTVLLLDGLDEAANQGRREKIVEMVSQAATQWRCRMVVTTRPGAHEGKATLKDFEEVRIEELDNPGTDGFLLQWCKWLKPGDEAAALDYYGQLRKAVAVPSIHILARNPLMLTTLAVLHLRRHRLPEQRAQLYEQIIDWLADQAVEKHSDKWRKDQLFDRFGKLALGMQTWKGGRKTQIGIDDAAGLLTPDQPIEPIREFLEQAQIDSGIVTLSGRDIEFWHLSFQEYLAARTLAGFPDTELQAAALQFLYSPEGREVLPLLAGHMAYSGPKRLDAVFESLISDAVTQKKLGPQAHATGVLGKMLADLTPLDYKLSGQAGKQFSRLRKTVMAILEKGKTKGIGLKTRVAAAEALDQTPELRLCTPDKDDYWVEFKSKKFWVGKFPVTVWEYGLYLVGNKEAVKPYDWDKQQLHLSRPVTGMTWHDALRYCDWATGKWKIKLPTEEQWSFAAYGAEGRYYPWGPEEEKPDEHRANFGMNVGEPTPVGMFPDGNTLEGVADMVGNVWEWTRSDYDKENKVARGASFYVGSFFLDAAYRLWIVPGNWLYDLGFRCVRE
ncbi:MAG: SUMF1/EgtB/PvdO family nonheme iron enzyme [Acidobacteriia bacterium]|nr:SUMF1/EgtB/PvdO family nonheme iron enzyme [Terriglobia bacterium]